jgi:hypothetical protein
MPIMKRKAPPRRRLYARRRIARRIPYAVKSRIPMLKIQRTTCIGNWTPNTTTTDGFWKLYTFQLQNITNSTEFTSLFDQYKMYALKYRFVPRFDNFSGNNTTDTTLPGVTNQGATRLHIVNDPFTSFGPVGTYTFANLNTFLEQGNRVKTYNGNRPVSVFFRTCIDSSGERKRAPFLNVTQNNVNHFGFHVFAQDVNMTGVFGQSWDVFVTAYLVLKNAR